MIFDGDPQTGETTRHQSCVTLGLRGVGFVRADDLFAKPDPNASARVQGR
jgi:hypothetical protein